MHEMHLYDDVLKINETMLYGMYAHVMMYEHEMLDIRIWIWENKSLIAMKTIVHPPLLGMVNKDGRAGDLPLGW